MDSFQVGWGLVFVLTVMVIGAHVRDARQPRAGAELPPKLTVVRPPPVPKRGRVARLLESLHLGERRP